MHKPQVRNLYKNNEKISEKKLTGQEYFMLESDYQKIYTKAELANTLASSGFRDMTRLAVSNSNLILDMLKFSTLQMLKN